MNKFTYLLLINFYTVHAQIVNCPLEQPPILFGNEDSSIIANGSSNASFYDGNFRSLQGNSVISPWPGYFGDVISLSLTRNEYISAYFNSGNTNYSARIQLSFSTYTEGLPPKGVAIAISECPGDFNIHINQDNCLIVGGSTSSLRWATDPNADASKYCILESNKDYYLNIVHSDNSENNNFNTSDCQSSYCGIIAVQIKE